MSDLWYKQAIIYAIDLEKFMDSDGDGVGDFPGLISKLDYLAELGVNCLWILPFYPSPNRDNGYDVADYYGVDTKLGSPGDFVEFIKAAEVRGMKVIVDLVMNHSSEEHPWFKASSRNMPKYADYYIWEKEKPKEDPEDIAFPGLEDSIWEYSEVRKEYYCHTFYKFQPDLNFSNPEVLQEVRKIIGFWLQLGASGLRIDGAEPLTRQKGTKQKTTHHHVLQEMRKAASWEKGDSILLAEANVDLQEILRYFGPKADVMQMMFNFYWNPYLFLALARKEAEPLVEVMNLLPEIPASGQWVNFLRNLDELNLGRLPKSAEKEVYRLLAPRKDMQIFDRGIRRRLAPLLKNNQQHIRLAFSLLFSMPGAPMIVYGDEIGMGDNLKLEGRNSVRTPMQWSSERNTGFSDLEEKLPIAPISRGEYGFKKINVESQRKDPESLLSWMIRLIRVRKSSPGIPLGKMKIVETASKYVFTHRIESDHGSFLFFHNLSDKKEVLEVTDHKFGEEIFCDGEYGDPGEKVHLNPYGYRWFLLS